MRRVITRLGHVITPITCSCASHAVFPSLICVVPGVLFWGFRTFRTHFRRPFYQNRFLFSHEVEFRSYEMNTDLMSCLFRASYHHDNSYFIKLGYDLVIRWPILISVWVFRLVTLQRRYEWIDTCQIQKDIFCHRIFLGTVKIDVWQE